MYFLPQFRTFMVWFRCFVAYPTPTGCLIQSLLKPLEMQQQTQPATDREPMSQRDGGVFTFVQVALPCRHLQSLCCIHATGTFIGVVMFDSFCSSGVNVNEEKGQSEKHKKTQKFTEAFVRCYTNQKYFLQRMNYFHGSVSHLQRFLRW